MKCDLTIFLQLKCKFKSCRNYSIFVGQRNHKRLSNKFRFGVDHPKSILTIVKSLFKSSLLQCVVYGISVGVAWLGR
jgi:hypothetical protein